MQKCIVIWHILLYVKQKGEPAIATGRKYLIVDI
jgi:hypothetical protein